MKNNIISSFIVFLAAFSLLVSPVLASPSVIGSHKARRATSTSDKKLPDLNRRDIRGVRANTNATATVGAHATSAKRILKVRSLFAKKHFAEKRKIRIRAFFERMMRRFEHAIARLDKLADRIESRLDKFEEKGRDVSESRALLEEARSSIASAEAAIEAARAAIEGALASEDPKEAFKEVKKLVREARDSIKKAHQDLVKAIRALKPGKLKSHKPSATSTDDGTDDDE